MNMKPQLTPAVLDLLNPLDLEPIMVKAIDVEEGYGWSLEKTKRIAQEYKKFLVLCLLNPDEAIVPSSLVDDFWHLHILDTQKYAEDCQNFLGFFLHHFPYFGMRGEKDLENLQAAWKNTLALYQKTFNTAPDADIWMKSKRCPNCGRRVGNDAQFEYRPRLVDILQMV
jgi:hypothetical protein